MKKEISSREDLLQLVSKFYEKLLADDSINYLFTDVAKIDIRHHLPVLVDFWDSIIFQSDTYRKNAMQPHLALHQKSSLTKHHFETWIRYFEETVRLIIKLFFLPFVFKVRLIYFNPFLRSNF